MGSPTSKSDTAQPFTDPAKSSIDNTKTTTDSTKALEDSKTEHASCACGSFAPKSKNLPTRVTIESGDDSDTSTGTVVKDKKSSPHADTHDETATIEVKKYNPIISKVNGKHRHTDPQPKSCNRPHVASHGLSGFCSLFENDYPINEKSDTDPQHSESIDPKVQPKPPTREANVHISHSKTDDLPKLLPIPQPPKTTYKSSLPLAQNTTFQISTTETRSSIMLSTLDLLARYDNHFHRTEYSNSFLRDAKEDAERKIEELEWKVRCFAQEEVEHRKDMSVLGGKFRDMQDELRGEKENVKELKREVKQGKELKERLEDRYEELEHREVSFGGIEEERFQKLNDRVEELEGDLKSVKGKLANAEDENEGLKESVRVLERKIATTKEEHDVEIIGYRQDINKYLDENHGLKHENRKLKAEIESQEQNLEQVIQELEQKKEESDSKDAKLLEREEAIYDTKSKFDKLTANIDSLEKQLQASHDLVFTKNEHSVHSNQTKDLQQRVFESAAEFESLHETIEDQAKELETLRKGDRIRSLEEEILGLKAINENLVNERQDFKEKAAELAKYAEKLPPTPPKRVALGGLDENAVNVKGEAQNVWAKKYQIIDA